MSVEAIVALGAAWTVRSPALLGFGGDSAIELFSAIIVLRRFRYKSDSVRTEKLAARVAGGLLFAVAAFVIVSSGLSLLGYREPQPSFVGIILLIVATTGMAWLASQKRKLATQVASASLSQAIRPFCFRFYPMLLETSEQDEAQTCDQPGMPVSIFVGYLGSLARSHAARSPSRRSV